MPLCFVLICGPGMGNPLPEDFEPVRMNGQITSWGSWSESGDDEIAGGLRFIPEFSLSGYYPNGRSLDVELSLRGWTANPGGESHGRPYRAWARYSGEQWELRAGLQKISFGPGRVLRSLRWFDRLDPRDPLGITDGVYALLYRRYSLNNSNLWLWGLHGNNEPKGLELYPSDEDGLEIGGRYQFPVKNGEMAVIVHRRKADLAAMPRIQILPLSPFDGEETRFALDGLWDVGPGIWFEAAAAKLRIDSASKLYNQYLTVGADYTFDYGPGIHWLVEHFTASSGPEMDEQDDLVRLTAVSADLSLNMLDTLSAIGYYDWDEQRIYSFLGWQRTLDDYLLHISVYESRGSDTDDYGGSGLRVMITYNF